jgi:uncharacterized protein YjbJ (UPF0337 family)
MSTEDRAKAAVQNMKGKAQEAVGAVTDDSKTENAGKAEQLAAKVRVGVEDAKDGIADAAKKVAAKVHDGIEHAKDELKK